MLLSHNCALTSEQVSSLSRSDFASIFIEGLKSEQNYQCRLIDNPHWIVEIIFDEQQTSPTEMAKLCAKCLSSYRSTNQIKKLDNHIVMLLGGMKTTPAPGTSPTSLQQGQWGVDVVETVSPEQFLADINWETIIKEKSSQDIFKVIQIVE